MAAYPAATEHKQRAWGEDSITVTIQNSTLVDLQNKIRGLISRFKSRAYKEIQRHPPPQVFRSGLSDALLDARKVLPPSQYDLFLKWVAFQIRTQLPRLSNSPIGYDYLSGVSANPALPLQRELLWIAARIRNEAASIADFRAAASNIESLVFAGDIDAAIELLRLWDEAHGASLWSVQLRIGLEQLSGGLERQKQYTASVRRIFKQGLLGFVAYHTSVRNEEKTTFPKYIEDVQARIERHKYFTPPIRTYLRFRLTNELPALESELADVLCVEQNHSIFDLYETFVAVIQELIRRESTSRIGELIRSSLISLRALADYRLVKALNALKVTEHAVTLPPRKREVSDALLNGNVVLAARNLRRYRDTTQIDPWDLIYAGFVRAHSKSKASRDFRSSLDIAQLLATLLLGTRKSIDAFTQLKKLSTNFYGITAFAGIRDFLDLIRRLRPDDPWRPWIVGLNSPTYGCEDGMFDSEIPSIDASLSASIWKPLWTGSQTTHPISNVFGVVFNLRNLCFNEAENDLRLLPDHLALSPAKHFISALSLHAYFGGGDRQSVIRFAAIMGSSSDGNLFFLPFVASLSSYVWADYKDIDDPLAAPIALNILWEGNDSASTASLLRFATGNVLRNSAIQRPSKLVEAADKFHKEELIYFLREVCVPEILDVSRVLKSTRAVLEERRAICAALRFLDPANSETYQQEAVNISNQLALAEGEWIVHRSRIHVDTTAFARWAMKDLMEDFNRYEDLLSLDDIEEQHFDDVLSEFIQNPSGTRSYAPDSEADVVLVQMLQTMGQEFLTNPSFGLDFYLSKRIRHQSFIGFIRGPMEFAKLITTRETQTGNYHKNEYWINKLHLADADTIELVNDALNTFSADFDALLIEAKERKFHVLSPEKPEGLISLTFSPQLLAITKLLVRRHEPDFATFSQTAIAVLWAALDPSLIRTRTFISYTLKAKIVGLFDELRASMRTVLRQEESKFLEFDMRVGQCSTDVQRALDEAAAWFSRADIEAQKRDFTIEQAVDIAIEAALKCQRAFEPEIERNVATNLQVSASSLIVLHDALFIALDNVRAHSGLKNPKVVLSVTSDPNSETVTIEVINEVKQHLLPSIEQNIAEIRQIIDDGQSGLRTRREGRSGFHKLSATVRQSSKGRLEFGIIPDGRFRLAATYSVITQPDEGLQE